MYSIICSIIFINNVGSITFQIVWMLVNTIQFESTIIYLWKFLDLCRTSSRNWFVTNTDILLKLCWILMHTDSSNLLFADKHMASSRWSEFQLRSTVYCVYVCVKLHVVLSRTAPPPPPRNRVGPLRCGRQHVDGLQLIMMICVWAQIGSKENMGDDSILWDRGMKPLPQYGLIVHPTLVCSLCSQTGFQYLTGRLSFWGCSS